MNLDKWDIVAVVLYFIAVMAAGLISMCRSNRGTVSGYFLAGRFMTWLPVGASLFASNIGSEHFIGLAGSGAAAGIGVGAFEFNACILLQLLGWVFLPVYIASGVCTLPEYMMRRYGGRRIQVYLAVLSLLLYILTKISVNLYSGSLFIREALGWNIWFAILLLLGMTAIVTVSGGLAAVMYTDTLQCFVMLIGAVVLTVISFLKVGGYGGLKEKYGSAIANETFLSNNTCGLPSKEAFIMLRPISDKEMPWLGFLLGQTPASIWYWCADQMMVQRALASKSLSHARGGTLVAGTIKLLPMFIMVMPGMISRVLYPDVLACSTPEACFAACGQKAGCSNMAYPKLVMGLMPSGLRGVMLAVMLAALMSDLTSIFNSASTLFTVDIYRLIRKDARNRELMIVGRAFVIIMIAISIVWIPVILEMQGGQLYIYIQMVVAYLAPPIAGVYVTAILWKRGNEIGAFSSLMYGFVLGIIRLIFDFAYREPLCGEVDTRPFIIRELHYMYFALFSFATSIIVNVVISLCTKPPSTKQLQKTTYFTLDSGLEDLPATNRLNPADLSNHMTFGQSDKLISKQGDLTGTYPDNGIDIVEMEKLAMDESCTKVEIRSQPSGVCSMVYKAIVGSLVWFCGMKESSQDQVTEEQNLQRITSLKQNPIARWAENIYLVILIASTAALYIIFSIPYGPITGGYHPINKSAVLYNQP